MITLANKVVEDGNGNRLYEKDGVKFWAKTGYEVNVAHHLGLGNSGTMINEVREMKISVYKNKK